MNLDDDQAAAFAAGFRAGLDWAAEGIAVLADAIDHEWARDDAENLQGIADYLRREAGEAERVADALELYASTRAHPAGAS